MKCSTFAREMRSLARVRGDLPPRLERHASACARCRRSWEDRLLLDKAIARWQARLPSVELADDVLAAAQTVLRRSSTSSRREAAGSPGGTGAITVALLALLLAGVGLMFPNATPQPRDAAAPPNGSEVATTNAANPPGESPSIAERGANASDGRAAAERSRRVDTLNLVEEIGGFVPGPWELAAVLDHETTWPTDSGAWLEPWTLLPAPE